MTLKQSKVLLTGGSSGIGKATAQLLRERGAQVCITGRDQEKLNQVAAELQCTPIHFDMSDFSKFGEKVADAVSDMGGINTLINNAGIGKIDLFEDVTLKDFQETFSTNVFGLSMLTQEVFKFFKVQKHGTIVNIGSSAAVKGFARGSVYSASKFAVRGLTQAWQAEMRPYNVRVMLVNPSEVPTAFAQGDRQERSEVVNKLTTKEIAHVIVSNLEMDPRGFVPELNVWATNPF